MAFGEHVPVRKDFFNSRLSPHRSQDTSCACQNHTHRRDDSHHNDKSDNCGYGSGDRRRPFTADQCPLHLCCFPWLLATSVGVCEQSNLSAIPGLAKSSCCGERNYGSQARSMTIRFYFKVAVEFVQSLAHSSQTDAGVCAGSTKTGQLMGGYAAAEIPCFQDCSFRLALKTDANLRSSGVAMHVGQALLQHTEKGNLHRDWQSFTIGRKGQAYVDPAPLGEALDIPLGGTTKACLVQQR